ncbi:MAG: LamG domain-containing protein [Gammaproteobacteria bacterium]|nr:LamG domain-containing protein [Gammaproteobacteria bacterium]
MKHISTLAAAMAMTLEYRFGFAKAVKSAPAANMGFAIPSGTNPKTGGSTMKSLMHILLSMAVFIGAMATAIQPVTAQELGWGIQTVAKMETESPPCFTPAPPVFDFDVVQSGNVYTKSIAMENCVNEAMDWRANPAMHFTGGQINAAGDYISVPNDPSLNPDVITIEFWARRFTNEGRYSRILGKYSNNLDAGWRFHWTGSQRNQVGFDVSNGRDNDMAGGNIPINQWAHIAGTYDGTHRKLYINGELAVQDEFTNGILNASVDLTFGQFMAWGIAYFKGEIDEVRIWSITRTQEQIRANMYRPLPEEDKEGLVGYWTFDETDGQALDYSGNGNHGTLHRFTKRAGSTAMLPEWVTDVSPLEGTSLTHGESVNVQMTISAPVNHEYGSITVPIVSSATVVSRVPVIYLHEPCEGVHAVFDQQTNLLTLPFIDTQVIDPITGGDTRQIAVLTGSLELLPGITDLIAKSVDYIGLAPKLAPEGWDACHARYTYVFEGGVAINDGKLDIPYMDVQSSIIVPGGISIPGPVNVYDVVLRPLATSPGIFHVDSYTWLYAK